MPAPHPQPWGALNSRNFATIPITESAPESLNTVRYSGLLRAVVLSMSACLSCQTWCATLGLNSAYRYLRTRKLVAARRLRFPRASRGVVPVRD